MDRTKVVKECFREFGQNIAALQCPLFQAPDGSGRGLSLTLGETTQPIFHPTRELLRSRIHRLLEKTGVIILTNHHLSETDESQFKENIGERTPPIPESWHGDYDTAINVLRRHPALLPPRPHPTCFSTVQHIVSMLEQVLPDFGFTPKELADIEYQRYCYRGDPWRLASIFENIVMRRNDRPSPTDGNFNCSPNRLLRMVSQASGNAPSRIHRHPWISDQPETILFWSNEKGNKGKNDIIHAKELVPVDDSFQSLSLHRAQIML